MRGAATFLAVPGAACGSLSHTWCLCRTFAATGAGSSDDTMKARSKAGNHSLQAIELANHQILGILHGIQLRFDIGESDARCRGGRGISKYQVNINILNIKYFILDFLSPKKFHSGPDTPNYPNPLVAPQQDRPRGSASQPARSS